MAPTPAAAAAAIEKIRASGKKARVCFIVRLAGGRRALGSLPKQLGCSKHSLILGRRGQSGLERGERAREKQNQPALLLPPAEAATKWSVRSFIVSSAAAVAAVALRRRASSTSLEDYGSL